MPKRNTVPKIVKPRFDEIVGLIEAVSRAHLTEEYVSVTRALAEVPARKRPSPLLQAHLNPTEVRVLDREVQRALVSSVPGLEAHILAHSEDSTRWHALGARRRQARGARSPMKRRSLP